MGKQRNALKAGIFIIASVAMAFGVIVGIKGLRTFLDPTEQRTVEFALADDLGGLRVGDDVRLGGYKVGEVKDIGVVLPDRIRVTFVMPRKYPVHERCLVAIQGTVTGQSWINFESLGDATLAIIKPETPLSGRPGALTAVINGVARETLPTLNAALANVRDNTVPRVNQILDDVHTQTVPTVNQTISSYRVTADTATDFIKDLRGYLKPVIDKYHVVADSTSQMMIQVRDLIGDTKTDFRGTVANLNAATGSIKEKLPPILDHVDGAILKVDKTVAGASEAMEDIKKTVEHTRELTGAARSVIAGNKGRLDAMIASLKTTSDNLKGASSEIRRSPWRLLYKPAPNEMGNLNLYDSARQFAEGADDLNDAAQALRDAVRAGQTDPEQLKKLMERVSKSFANFNEVEEKLWKGVQE